MKRLASIDMLRGFVMVIMALDHVRDMTTQPQPVLDPAQLQDFSGAGGALFFTRWITHICAPTFILLAGTGSFLYGAKGRGKGDVARFLLSRGVWLLFIELSAVNFAWNLNLGSRMIVPLQVIWAIAWSMIALAGLIWLPRVAIAAAGAAMVVGHNLLDGVQPLARDASNAWLLLHIQGPLKSWGLPVQVVYPLVPWIGVMALGYAMGPYFVAHRAERPKRLIQIGALGTLVFFALRVPNLYGEPVAWMGQTRLAPTLVSFFNTTKYPPSLQYLLMTLGPALMLLGWCERLTGRIAEALVTIGRVPLFYYVVHLYVIHAVAIVIGLIQGFSARDIAVVFLAYPKGFGVTLGSVYVICIATILALYPACVWFAGVKARHRSWWISYL